MALKSNNFVVIFGWMCNELSLKGNELLIYALIYGFSQDGESAFTGGRKYIADTLNISMPTVDKALSNLVENGLIEKMPFEVNNVTFNHYKISLGVVKKLYGGSKETLPYNIDNKKESDNIFKNILSSKKSGMENFEFGKKKTNPKSNLYNQCIACIDSYREVSSELRSALISYLQYRISIKEKPLYVNMWKGMLNKLFEFPYNQWTAIVKQSIELGYLSFYPLKSSGAKVRLSEPDGVGCEQATEADDEKRGEFIRDLRERGKRADF